MATQPTAVIKFTSYDRPEVTKSYRSFAQARKALDKWVGTKAEIGWVKTNGDPSSHSAVLAAPYGMGRAILVKVGDPWRFLDRYLKRPVLLLRHAGYFGGSQF